MPKTVVTRAAAVVATAVLAAAVLATAALLAACNAEPPPPATPARVQAVSAEQTAPLAAAAPESGANSEHAVPASMPASQHAAPKAPLCDQVFDKAGKNAGPKFTPPAGKKPGKGPLWVNFWAAWCKPCVQEIPHLKAWAAAHDFRVLFVSLDDDHRQWEQGIKQHGLEDNDVMQSVWLAPSENRGRFLRQLRLAPEPSLPQQLLVDGAGRVRCKRGGAIDAGEEAPFAEFIKTLR